MKLTNIINESVIVTLHNIKTGSIKHHFRISKGRATLVESPNNPTAKLDGLSFNCAATVDEVESLIGVLEELKVLMKKSLKKSKPEIKRQNKVKDDEIQEREALNFLKERGYEVNR